MTELQRYRPPVLGLHEQLLEGDPLAVNQQMSRFAGSGRLLESRRVPAKRAGQRAVVVTLLPARDEPAARPRIHPGWIVGILAAATAAILAAAVLAFVVFSAIAAATSLILGVLAVLGLVRVGTSLDGGGSSGTWKTN